MRFSTLGMSVALGLSVLAMGCDQNEPAAPTATDAKTAAESAAANAQSAAESAKSSAEKASAAASEVADKAGAAAADVKDQAAGAASELTAQAQKLFDDAKAAISKADFDNAQKYVDQLKGLSDKLPADWKAKVDELAKMLTDARAKLGNLPGLPK